MLGVKKCDISLEVGLSSPHSLSDSESWYMSSMSSAASMTESASTIDDWEGSEAATTTISNLSDTEAPERVSSSTMQVLSCFGGVGTRRDRRTRGRQSSKTSTTTACKRQRRRCATARRIVREALRDGTGRSIDWHAIVRVAQEPELSATDCDDILASAVLWGHDDGFRSVLSVAVEEDREDYVGLFLARGANPNRVAAWHEDTPLLACASFRGSVSIARKLLAYGAHVEGIGVPDVPCCEPPKSISVLGCAAYRGHLALVKLLLEHGANPNYVESVEGCSVLHFAAQGSHRDSVSHRFICETLIFDYNANTMTRDSKGSTPADLAEQAGDPILANFLRNGSRKQLVRTAKR